jgi:hypothetical protein
MTDPGRTELGTNPERRQYNRRSGSDAPPPPYFEAFERIAVALEDIAQTLTVPRASGERTRPPYGKSVRLPR